MTLREDIVTAAYHLFATKGYDATSMQDIVKSAKTTKGGLYHHFQSKEELLFESIKNSMKKYETDIQSVLSQTNTKKKLLLIGEQVIKIHSKDPDFNQMVLEINMLARKNQHIAKEITKARECKKEFLAKILSNDFSKKDSQQHAKKLFFILESIVMQLSIDSSQTNYIDFWNQEIEDIYAKKN